MRLHEDQLERERTIARYLRRELPSDISAQFESHFLYCEDCYDELRATEMLLQALAEPRVGRKQVGDVALVEFNVPVQLVRESAGLAQLREAVGGGDRKVLIDLSRVSRIDSTGLGMLMSCYSHVMRNNGSLKLLKPSQSVQQVLQITHMDSVLEAYDDPAKALESFS
jgi:anti-sigma B factor antagonist